MRSWTQTLRNSLARSRSSPGEGQESGKLRPVFWLPPAPPLSSRARKVERLEAVAEGILGAGGRCIAVPTDVRREDDIDELVDRTVSELGRVDIVVNNAGGSYLFPMEDTPVDRWDNSFALNVRGPFMLTQAAGRHMLSQGSGVFVNISSAAGLTGVVGGVAYSASKAALQMLTRVVAMEWGGRGIRANCIAVGAIASEGALRSWTRAGLIEKGILDRAGQPEDIANGIFYLATDSVAIHERRDDRSDRRPLVAGRGAGDTGDAAIEGVEPALACLVLYCQNERLMECRRDE